MDTKKTEISGANSCDDAVEKTCQLTETMEFEATPDDINLSEETINEHGEPTTIKEAIEILKIELVTPGKVESEVAEVKSHNSNAEKIQENIDTDQINDTEITNQKEANIIEQITNSAEAEIEPNTSQKSVNTVPTKTGLSLLAQYDSDNESRSSESDSVIEVPIASNQDYRNQVVEINSDTDSDDSDSDVEYLNELRKTIEKRMETTGDGDEEDDADGNEENANKRKHKPKLKVKGELLLEDLPPIQDLKITVPEEECIEFGKIHSIVDQLVLVSVLPNSILLDLGTVLFLEKGQKVLGEVFDVLGQVADPWYCVRFNSNEQIIEKEINLEDVVYVAPKTQYTQYVILSNLMKQKGSDASWENDIEPPPRFLEYSDDEQEQLARRQLRNKDRPVDNDDPTKRTRTNEDDDNLSVSGRSNQATHPRTNRRGNRGGTGHYNSYSRSPNPASNQYNSEPQSYHRGSWHSNYYRQPFPSHYRPPASYGMQSNQTYPSQYPPYPMPSMHNMPYAPLPTQYGAPPPMMHQPPVQIMPNNFNVRPAILQGSPHVPFQPQQQYSPSPPSPPGGH